MPILVGTVRSSDQKDSPFYRLPKAGLMKMKTAQSPAEDHWREEITCDQLRRQAGDHLNGLAGCAMPPRPSRRYWRTIRMRL
jgi:hypothetical protein